MTEHDRLYAPVWHTDGLRACIKHEYESSLSFQMMAWFYVCLAVFIVILNVITTLMTEGIDRPAFYWLTVQTFFFIGITLGFACAWCYLLGYMRYRFQTQYVVYEAENALIEDSWND